MFFVRQPYPKGLGDAVLQAKSFIGDEPFVVMLGDDIMRDEVPLTKQLIDAYEQNHASNIAVMRMPMEEISKYGVIDIESQLEEGLYNVKKFVEKPKMEEAPSDLAIIGRYLLTPEIFDLLEKQEVGAGGEVQLTDAIDTLNKTQRVFAKEFNGQRFDVGNKLEFMKSSILVGLEHQEIGDELKDFVKKIAETL